MNNNGLSLDTVFTTNPAATFADPLSELQPDKSSRVVEVATTSAAVLTEKRGKVAELAGVATVPAETAPEQGSKVAGFAALTPELKAAAMEVCDWHGDTEADRLAMLDELADYPPASWPDLLDHFRLQIPPLPELGCHRVHVQELTLVDGSRISFDADIPAGRLTSLLASGHAIEQLPEGLATSATLLPGNPPPKANAPATLANVLLDTEGLPKSSKAAEAASTADDAPVLAFELVGQALITDEDLAAPILAKLGYTVHYIRDTNTARDAVTRLLEADRPLLGLDIETGGLDPLRDRTRCLQVADESTAYVFDFDGVEPATLWPLMNCGGMFVAHNATFEWRFLQRLLLQPLTTLHDSMLMARTAYGLQPGGGYPSLADTAARVLGLTIDKSVRRSDWTAPGPLTPAQVHYAALDAVLAFRLAHPLRDRLRDTGQTKAYGLQLAALPTVAGHMLDGVPFDREGHRRLMAEWKAAAMTARDGLDRIMPGVNPDSPDQLAEWLTRSAPADLLATWPRTASGKLGTDADALAGWPGVPPELRQYKEHAKLLSTYGEKYAGHIHPDTGRIHASYNIAGTRGGRFNCSKPNLQNPPRLAAFRRLFRPKHEMYRFIVADYSQIELRIAALISGDQTMLQAYRDGVDLHRLTASITAGIPLADVTKDQRQAAKAINFGLIYGMGPAGLRAYAKATYGVDMSPQAAQDAHNAFFRNYTGIHRWHAETKARGVYDKTVRTAAGLIRDMGNEPGGWKLTNALNTPVQGSGAEVLLLALAKLPAALAGLDCRVIHHVHDEIILECSETDIEAGKVALQSAMVAAFDELFPGSGMTAAGDLVEAHDGRTWEDAKG
jgi:DNA polymerase-1